MKYVLLLSALLLTACDQPPPQTIIQVKEVEVPAKPNGCDINTSSHLVTEHVVSSIKNLVKEKDKYGTRNLCTVDFDLEVDGQTHHLHEFEIGLEQQESLCYYAQQRARKELLLSIGGTFRSEADIQCRRHES